MDEVVYVGHRIRFHRSTTRWFAYVFPPSGPRPYDEVVTATLEEGRDGAFLRACDQIEARSRRWAALTAA